MEDIITVVNGRNELIEEAKTAPASIRRFLAEQFEIWLQDRNFMDALAGHILPGSCISDTAATYHPTHPYYCRVEIIARVAPHLQLTGVFYLDFHLRGNDEFRLPQRKLTRRFMIWTFQ